MRVHVRRLAFLFLALVAACSMRPSTTRPEERFVQVENQGFPDMNIYVVEGARRQRIGVAPGNSTTKLMLPRSMSRGIKVLRFVADPIGGRRQSVTQDLTVGPGENISLVIPP